MLTVLLHENAYQSSIGIAYIVLKGSIATSNAHFYSKCSGYSWKMPFVLTVKHPHNKLPKAGEHVEGIHPYKHAHGQMDDYMPRFVYKSTTLSIVNLGDGCKSCSRCQLFGLVLENEKQISCYVEYLGKQHY